MSDVFTFKSNDFGKVRTASDDGESLFCCADVLRVLDLYISDYSIMKRFTGTVMVPVIGYGKREERFLRLPHVLKLAESSSCGLKHMFVEWATKYTEDEKRMAKEYREQEEKKAMLKEQEKKTVVVDDDFEMDEAEEINQMKATAKTILEEKKMELDLDSDFNADDNFEDVKEETNNNGITVFENKEFGSVRTIIRDGEPWFVAKDVSNILGYAQTSNMIKRIDEEDFISSKLDDMNMMSLLINESGLYSAILGSKMPDAKKFKRWVTSEVLPSIRKHGEYSTSQKVTPRELYLSKAMLIAGDVIQDQKKQIAEQTQRADKAEQVIKTIEDDTGCYSMNQTAKALKLGYGDKLLFATLRGMGILNADNTPRQNHINVGRFKVVIKATRDGRKPVTVVTNKGLVYLAKVFDVEIDENVTPDNE